VNRSLPLALALVASIVLALGSASSASALSMGSQTFQLSGANSNTRLTVGCPGGKKVLPYSGGMISDTVGPNGEGIYPHSFERLGVQRGWHVSAVLFAPGPQANATLAATLQVVCGPRLGPVRSPHSTVFVHVGESQTAVATCPKGNRLFAGGFQRTNFVDEGGAYITGSYAVGDRTWQVTGGAHGAFGGELTAIAYCLRSGGPLVSEVSAQTPVGPRELATASTPACPPGSSLVSGGFTTTPSGPALIAAGFFDPQGGWTSSAFNAFGSPTTLTAHGYCMTAATITRRAKMRHGTRGAQEKVIAAPPVLDRALGVAISERVLRDGCYPGPADLVAALKQNGIQASQATNPGGVGRDGVYVLSAGSGCDRVLLAVRQRNGVVVLDSASGEVKLVKVK
jgi:hypothetical protein